MWPCDTTEESILAVMTKHQLITCHADAVHIFPVCIHVHVCFRKRAILDFQMWLKSGLWWFWIASLLTVTIHSHMSCIFLSKVLNCWLLWCIFLSEDSSVLFLSSKNKAQTSETWGVAWILPLCSVLPLIWFANEPCHGRAKIAFSSLLAQCSFLSHDLCWCDQMTDRHLFLFLASQHVDQLHGFLWLIPSFLASEDHVWDVFRW